jgi:hypothetical protein
MRVLLVSASHVGHVGHKTPKDTSFLTLQTAIQRARIAKKIVVFLFLLDVFRGFTLTPR